MYAIRSYYAGILYNYDGLMFDDLGQEAPAKINTLIFTKALDKNIICGLNIGSPIDAIYEKLGVPNATTYDGSNFIFYLNGYSVVITSYSIHYTKLYESFS